MKRTLLCIISIIVLCVSSACDNEFIDLTKGKVTINEINGAKANGPYITVDSDSKVYRSGENIYDKTDFGASGNNNNCLDPGETIRYRLKVRNVGKKDAIAVQAVVSTVDRWVTNLENTGHYLGFISSGRKYDYAATANIGNSWSDTGLLI